MRCSDGRAATAVASEKFKKSLEIVILLIVAQFNVTVYSLCVIKAAIMSGVFLNDVFHNGVSQLELTDGRKEGKKEGKEN